MSLRMLLPLFAALLFASPLRGEERVILPSPSGLFEIVQDGETYDREWTVLVKDRAQRHALGTPHDAQPHTYFVSPDERWIFAHVHIGSRMGAAKLFRRGKGVQFLPDRGEDGWLDDPVWRFYWSTVGVKPHHAGPGDEGIIDFVAWSPDAARVLLALRAGEKRGKGIYRWHAYLNVRTGKLELTDYLRALNRDAARRWEDDAFRARWAPPASAEPVDPLPSEAGLKSRWEMATDRLNQLYAKSIQAAKDEGKATLRAEQTDWLAKRDAGANAYATSGKKSDRGQRKLQFLAEATEARNRELLEAGDRQR